MESKKRKLLLDESTETPPEKKQRVEVTPTPDPDDRVEMKYFADADVANVVKLARARERVTALLQQIHPDYNEIQEAIDTWKNLRDSLNLNDTAYSNRIFGNWLSMAGNEQGVVLLLDRIDDIVDSTFWNDDTLDSLISVGVGKTSLEILSGIFNSGQAASQGWEGFQDETFEAEFFRLLEKAIQRERSESTTPEKEIIWAKMLKIYRPKNDEADNEGDQDEGENEGEEGEEENELVDF